MTANAQLHQVVDACDVRNLNPRVTNGTLEEAARSFAQAMIDADLAALQRVSRGASAGYPTGYVLDTGRDGYANRTLADLTFDIFEDENRVCIRSRDGELHEDLKFKRSGGAFYFIYYNR